MNKLRFAIVFAIILWAGSYTTAHTQVLKTLGDRAKAKINQRANQKADNAMDKGLNEAEAATKAKKDGNGDVKTKDENGTKTKTDADGDVKVKSSGDGKEKTESFTYTSKYDFVPGEKIIAFEDFSNTDVGDFPTRWNTNATAEVVTLNSKEGKWLKINKQGVWLPEFISSMPESFTLEFDLGVSDGFDGNPFVVNIGNMKDRAKNYTDFAHYINWRYGFAMHMWFVPYNFSASARARVMTSTDGNAIIDNPTDYKGWDNAKNNFAHISLWRQNERLRVYLNGQKLYDVPKAFPTGSKYNLLTFAMQGSYKPERDYYFLGNIRLAVGAPDTRNKLITEGKFVTRGILFDVGSDKIKGESYGAIKDIATVLKENADIKVKIVGHTDSDGDDKGNQALSEKRAAAVKAYLAKEFGVNVANISTEGKGESAPIDKNITAEGKANNRRVEFIKL